MLTVTEIKHPHYGRCIEISNGKLFLVATIEVGPRIISFSQEDKENVFFEDVFETVTESGEFFDNTFGKGTKWYIYGGHRLWSSPQDMYSYYPDNAPIEYEVLDKKVILKQHIQKVTKIELQLEVSFKNDNLVEVIHKITNKDSKEKTLSPWALTVLKGGGLEVIPLPKNNTGLAPQKIISIWDFGAKSNDKRTCFGDRFFTMKHDPENNKPIKVGLRVIDNYALYFLPTKVFLKTFEYLDNVQYPDNNVNVETYQDNRFIEVETLGELKTLQTGETVTHTECWSLFNNEHGIPELSNEEQIEQSVRRYIK